MTNSITPQTKRTAPLRCPECGCSKFVETVYGRTVSRALFFDRDEYPKVSPRAFEREVDEIHIHCERCDWVAVPAELVEASGRSA